MMKKVLLQHPSKRKGEDVMRAGIFVVLRGIWIERNNSFFFGGADPYRRIGL